MCTHTSPCTHTHVCFIHTDRYVLCTHTSLSVSLFLEGKQLNAMQPSGSSTMRLAVWFAPRQEPAFSFTRFVQTTWCPSSPAPSHPLGPLPPQPTPGPSDARHSRIGLGHCLQPC